MRKDVAPRLVTSPFLSGAVMLVILIANEHSRISRILKIVGVISGQSVKKVVSFTWIAIALTPVPKRHINLLSGWRR